MIRCTECGCADMKVVATRMLTPFVTRRRLMCREHGHRFWTREVLETVEIRPQALEKAERGAERRRSAFELRQAVAAREGVKATAVAHELGITEARVRQIRKELCDTETASGSARAPHPGAQRKPATWLPC